MNQINQEQQGPSGLSIAALVTGILWMSIIPIILGAVDMGRIKNNLASPKGKGMDIAGIILGSISTLFWIIWIIVIVVAGAFFWNASLY
jgi:hypothetical protein